MLASFTQTIQNWKWIEFIIDAITPNEIIVAIRSETRRKTHPTAVAVDLHLRQRMQHKHWLNALLIIGVRNSRRQTETDLMKKLDTAHPRRIIYNAQQSINDCKCRFRRDVADGEAWISFIRTPPPFTRTDMETRTENLQIRSRLLIGPEEAGARRWAALFSLIIRTSAAVLGS